MANTIIVAGLRCSDRFLYYLVGPTGAAATATGRRACCRCRKVDAAAARSASVRAAGSPTSLGGATWRGDSETRPAEIKEILFDARVIQKVLNRYFQFAPLHFVCQFFNL